LGYYHNTDKIIEESKLNHDIDRNVIYGDVVYLGDSQLIKGQSILGLNHPHNIKITNYGIDYVDNVINTFMEQEQKEFEALKNENDPKTKAKKVLEVISKNQGLFTTFINFLSKFSG